MNTITMYGEIVFNQYGNILGVIYQADAEKGYYAQYLFSVEKSFLYTKERHEALEWLKQEHEHYHHPVSPGADPPFKVGMKVRMALGPQHYRDNLGIGVIQRITNKRIVVQWEHGRSRNHVYYNLVEAK